MNYFLTGRAVSEYTLATTTQLFDVRRGEWSRPLCQAAGIPAAILPEVVPPGHGGGTPPPGHRRGVRAARAPAVVAPACHDTGGAWRRCPRRGGRAGATSPAAPGRFMGIELARRR